MKFSKTSPMVRILLAIVLLQCSGMVHTETGSKASPLILLFEKGTVHQNSSYSSKVLDSLYDGPSLYEKVEKWSERHPVDPMVPTLGNSEVVKNVHSISTPLCKDLQLLSNAILNAIAYYEAHIDQIVQLDSAVGLQVLESLENFQWEWGLGVLSHTHDSAGESGQNVQVQFAKRLRALIEQIVSQSANAESDENYRQEITGVGNDRRLFSLRFTQWKEPNILNNKVAISNIGHDKETVWGKLNGQCQAALINRCEVPYACQRTFLDPQPQSQYMLTHQALYLQFANQTSCNLQHPELFQGLDATLENQCAKMYREAEFLAQNGFPEWGWDLFSEYVFICGSSGYSNFLQRDWMNTILSWQSKSSYGCFVNSEHRNYITNDGGFVRKLTEMEKSSGVQSESEICRPHLTSTSLAALVVHYKYLRDLCHS